MKRRLQPAGRRKPLPRGAGSSPPAPVLTAFALFPSTYRIQPAPRLRDWMSATDGRFAYRCLPLVMANQAGWIITSGWPVVAVWDGGPDRDSLAVSSPDGDDPPASSQFGHGILTWDVPFLFRTPRGYNLLVRGPANWWKDGAVALEGLVEADWAVATFTVNWKLTRPGAVRFEPDDPICQLVPQRRGELEAFRTRARELASAPALRRQYRSWAASRDRVVRALDDPSRPDDAPATWQLHYLRGTSPAGARAHEHQTKLRLSEFQ